MWLDSSFCQLKKHGDCDGLVHWVPMGIDGRDWSHLPEPNRPRDLRPVTCTCQCHRKTRPSRARRREVAKLVGTP